MPRPTATRRGRCARRAGWSWPSSTPGRGAGRAAGPRRRTARTAGSAGRARTATAAAGGRSRRVARLSPYDGPAKALVRRAKYGGRWELATALGRLLAATPAARGLLTPDAVVVAVPLHPSRRRSRGFDQAALIAGPLAAAIGARPAEVLARARPTRPQAALSGAAERRGNVRDAFALLHPGPVAGRPVVLVDDVLTTGATVRAAARALAPAKPASVAAAVAAVAGAKRGGFDE